MKLSPTIWLVNGSILFNLLASPSTEAQIVPDATLPENSVVTTQDNMIQIKGGTRVGDNLFHSFERFSVPTDNTAYFNNAVDVRNILSRVTGRSISEIDGLIKANGTANLFLINPNGIIFGLNAQLDIGGSFVASTASRIIFADGFEFYTTATQTQPLLTISVPIGLGLGEMPGRIVNRSIVSSGDDLIGLRVRPNQTLALVGGDVVIEGGFLSTEGGRIELGSVAGNNIVSLTPINQGWVLGYEGIQNFQDISLSQAAFVVSAGNRSGDIHIHGRRVTLTEGSRVAVVALTEGQAGNLTVKATESVNLEGNSPDLGFDFSLLLNDVRGEAKGDGSKLTVETQRLTLKNGAQISAGTFGTGQGVDLKVSASEVELEGAFINANNRIFPSGLFARVRDKATGNGGTLTIDTDRLTVKDGATVSTETFGAGRAGNLLVNASESIELIGTVPGTNNPSQLASDVVERATATGNGGNLTVNTRRLTVRDGAQIGTTARNQGQGGILTINADSIILSGTSPLAEFRSQGRSGIFVSAEPAFKDNKSGNVIITTAKAGELKITTGELIVERGAVISADNFGIGQGSNVILNIDRLIIRDGGQIGAGSLLEKDAVNNERGPGGTLTVNASESIEVIGTGSIGSTSSVPSSLFTLAEGTGKAGSLNIFTPNLTVRDGAEINVSSQGSETPGKAGDLQIQARSIALDNSGILRADTKGGGGNIELTSPSLIVRRNSSITTNAEGSNIPGGNITLNTDILAALENSDISANSEEFRGGNVTINAQAIFGTQRSDALTSESDITATGRTQAGTITINTPDVDPSSGLIELPESFVDASSLVDRRCSPSNRASSFVVTGSGGLPASPIAVLGGDAIDVNWVTLPEQNSRGLQEQRSKRAGDNFIVGDRIIEAQGWVTGPNGEVILTATPPTATPHNSWPRPIDCP